MYVWKCKCDCGNTKEVPREYLRLRVGGTKSCGCLVTDFNRINNPKRSIHGHCKRGKESRTYISYKGAKRRCNNPKHPKYGNYGGAGVKFLFTSVKQLIAEIGERPVGKSLDRYPNPAGNYEPGNVRWATSKEQGMNRRIKKPDLPEPWCFP